VVLEITDVELTYAKLYPNTAFSFTYSFINAGLDAQGVIGWVDLLYLSTTEDPSGTKPLSTATLYCLFSCVPHAQHR
jgi:hypothetical protein